MRRIVTGFNEEGKATLASVDQLPPAVFEGNESQLLYLWRTFAGHTVPVPAGDPTEGMVDFFPAGRWHHLHRRPHPASWPGPHCT